MDLFSRRYAVPEVAGERVLCLGLGGGADAISACWWASILQQAGADAHFGNTKRDVPAALRRLSPNVSVFSTPPEPLQGRDDGVRIDASLPRGAGGSPLVVQIPRRPEAETLEAVAAQLRARGYDRVVGIDNGGDVLQRRRRAGSRDFQALQVLRAMGLPCEVVVVGLCADGTAPARVAPQLERFSAQTYRGCVPLAAHRDALAGLSAGLRETRTVRLMLDALQRTDSHITVPRGARPRVLRRWLTHAFVFDVAPFFAR